MREVEEVRRLARLGLPDRDYLKPLWMAHAQEWRAVAAEDDPTIDVLAGLCASEGIGAPADAGEAFRRFGIAARLGSTTGMVREAGAYASGTGVEQDPTLAALLYRRAADAGDPDGMVGLAAAHAAGVGVAQDDAEAFRLYKAASDAGDPDGDVGVSVAYRLGRGVPESPAEAVTFMRRAVDAKSTVALMTLGNGYARETKGFDPDPVIAARWYRHAADLGNPDAMLRLSDLCLADPPVHSNPDGPSTRPTVVSEPDLSGAVAWVRRAATTGEPASLTREGDLLSQGLPPVLKPDGPAAMIDYRRAVAAGGTAALGRLGHAYQVGWQVERDVNAARDLYRRGASAGDADCMAALAATYDEGFKGLDHDSDTEAFWYQRAAATGNVAGMLGLGGCYLNGTGVRKDPATAARWYAQAARAGSSEAMNGLGMVYNAQGGQGVGSGRDPAQAATWFEQAAQRGDGSGMRNLARSYTEGNGVPVDGTRAITLFQLSIRTFQAQHDDRRAAEVMLDLAKLYAAGPVGTRDAHLTVEWANKSATAGEPAAWTFLGDLSAQGAEGVRRDPGGGTDCVSQGGGWRGRAGNAGGRGAAAAGERAARRTSARRRCGSGGLPPRGRPRGWTDWGCCTGRAHS